MTLMMPNTSVLDVYSVWSFVKCHVDNVWFMLSQLRWLVVYSPVWTLSMYILQRLRLQVDGQDGYMMRSSAQLQSNLFWQYSIMKQEALYSQSQNIDGHLNCTSLNQRCQRRWDWALQLSWSSAFGPGWWAAPETLVVWSHCSSSSSFTQNKLLRP